MYIVVLNVMAVERGFYTKKRVLPLKFRSFLSVSDLNFILLPLYRKQVKISDKITMVTMSPKRFLIANFYLLCFAKPLPVSIQ